MGSPREQTRTFYGSLDFAHFCLRYDSRLLPPECLRFPASFIEEITRHESMVAQFIRRLKELQAQCRTATPEGEPLRSIKLEIQLKNDALFSTHNSIKLSPMADILYAIVNRKKEIPKKLSLLWSEPAPTCHPSHQTASLEAPRQVAKPLTQPGRPSFLFELIKQVSAELTVLTAPKKLERR